MLELPLSDSRVLEILIIKNKQNTGRTEKKEKAQILHECNTLHFLN